MFNQKKIEVINSDLEYILKNSEATCDFNDSYILITGCAGFLGFYITQFFVKYYKSLGIKKIIALDSFILGRYPSWLNQLEKDYPEIISVNKFIVGKDDISKIENYEKITYVMHMASIASPSFYRKFPLETIDANIWGLRDLLEVYKNSQCLKGFLFFSSSEIYGDPDDNNIPTNEKFRGYVSCTGPRACYDESKRFGETLCTIYRQKHNMPLSIVRPFNNYGPGMNVLDKRLPADLAKFILENKDIYILSDGSPTRTFCYVADAIVGFFKVLCSSHYTEFNIGMDKPEISVIELAKIYQNIGKLNFGYEGEIIKKESEDPDYLKDNPNRRQPDVSKAMKILDFQPTIGIEQGVEKFLWTVFS